jgi:hypothetical protein
VSPPLSLSAVSFDLLRVFDEIVEWEDGVTNELVWLPTPHQNTCSSDFGVTSSSAMPRTAAAAPISGTHENADPKGNGRGTAVSARETRKAGDLPKDKTGKDGVKQPGEETCEDGAEYEVEEGDWTAADIASEDARICASVAQEAEVALISAIRAVGGHSRLNSRKHMCPCAPYHYSALCFRSHNLWVWVRHHTTCLWMCPQK